MSDHEVVSFATFLDYRDRRIGAPGVPGAPVQDDGLTRPADELRLGAGAAEEEAAPRSEGAKVASDADDSNRDSVTAR
jgi:hypothetical protein